MKEVKTWTVRPTYRLRKGRHKFKYIRGMIIVKSEAAAIDLYQHFKDGELEVTMQYETLMIKGDNDEED